LAAREPQVEFSEIVSIIKTRYEANESFLSVIQTIVKKHYDYALVCEYNKPIGIITERYVHRFLPNYVLKEEMTAGHVMSHDPTYLC
jgi:hypothetical protein|tara:strand:- start:612 stop:872 length:261 start_codon:yes stop_codon:yes gene_type:complete